MPSHALVAVAALALCAVGPAQGPPARGSPAPQTAADRDDPKASKTKTIAIVGASASAGFSDQFITVATGEDRRHNQTFRLRQALAPLFDGEAVAFKDYADVSMFLHAERSGIRQITRALRGQPDAVLAIDFLFWFGYTVEGGDKAARLALQEKGLAVLERVDAPLLVGDYPPLKDIDPRMLRPAAVPDPETLAELNRRLRAWAEIRSNVRVFPLSELLVTLREEKCVVDLEGGSFELDSADMLQTDGLHVTRLGMALLAEHVVDSLRSQLPWLRAEADALPEIVRRLELRDVVRQAGKPLEAAAAAGQGGANGKR